MGAPRPVEIGIGVCLIAIPTGRGRPCFAISCALRPLISGLCRQICLFPKNFRHSDSKKNDKFSSFRISDSEKEATFLGTRPGGCGFCACGVCVSVLPPSFLLSFFSFLLLSCSFFRWSFVSSFFRFFSVFLSVLFSGFCVFLFFDLLRFVSGFVYFLCCSFLCVWVCVRVSLLLFCVASLVLPGYR